MPQKECTKLSDNPDIRSLIRKQLAGYRRVNEFIDIEKRRKLQRMTVDESRAIFVDLCRAWEHSFKQNPSLGDLERQRLHDLLEYRRIFNLLATKPSTND